MDMLRKILAPTDFSDLSARGVRYACQLAKDVGAELVIINVVILDETNTIDKQEVAKRKQRLDDFVAQIPNLGANPKIGKVVVAGQPYGAILDCADSERIDLIVMSSHGRSGLSRMLIGSVTDKILRGAPCPVLVVPSDQKD
jgi:universal stress protein A